MLLSSRLLVALRVMPGYPPGAMMNGDRTDYGPARGLLAQPAHGLFAGSALQFVDHKWVSYG